MQSRSLVLAACLALCSIAPARSPIRQGLAPIPAPVRNAGIYHVATGSWTRPAAQAGLRRDVLYDNTCPTGYFMSLADLTVNDEGRVPSQSSPTTLTSRPGCREPRSPSTIPGSGPPSMPSS